MTTVNERFPALGSSVQGGMRTGRATGREIFAEIRARIGDFERRFSRFEPDSELSRLNRSAGTPCTVSADMLDLLTASLRMWNATDRLVDPSVGNALTAAGYDVSFEMLNARDNRPRPGTGMRNSRFSDVIVDGSQRTVTIPNGMCLDFGGIGKGYLLDALQSTVLLKTEHFWLSLGGDLIVSGTDDAGHPWPVMVQDPAAHDRNIAQLNLLPGRWGVATSGTTKRRGTRDGSEWHHLIDPRTGAPAVTDVVAATIIAATALEADAFAKTVLIKGSKEGLAWAARQKDVEALVVTADHAIIALPSTDMMLTRL